MLDQFEQNFYHLQYVVSEEENLPREHEEAAPPANSIKLFSKTDRLNRWIDSVDQ